MTIHSERRNGVIILHTAGEIDISNVHLLSDSLTVIASQKAPRIIIDMTETTFVDSSVLGVLVDFFKSVRTYGGCIRLSNLRPVIARAFSLTKLDRVFELHEGLESAIAEEWG